MSDDAVVVDPPKRRPGRPKKVVADAPAEIKTTVTDAEFNVADFSDASLVIDLNRVSTRDDGKALPLPEAAVAETTCFAVKLQGKPGSVKEEGWRPAILVPSRKTELSDPRPASDRLYPAIQPGYKYDQELFENPAKNVVVKTKTGLMTKLEALAKGVAHSPAITVNRRAWRLANSADQYVWEDPMASAAQMTKTRPVVDVTLWCPMLTTQDPKAPHGEYLGVGESRVRGSKLGAGTCPRCVNDKLRADAVVKIAWLQKGGVL